MKNNIFLEDCEVTLDRNLFYDYALFSPPDFEEIGYSPSQIEDYKTFLLTKFDKLKPNNGYVTIFVSDRKFKGSVVDKHTLIRQLMETVGYKLVHQKIWVRSYKKNLYRMNYTFILTFYNGNGPKQNTVLPDVFYAEHKSVGSYNDNFNRDIAKTMIEAYTDSYHVVLDPFMGSGTTALACLDTDRYYLGSEIDPEVWQIGADVLGNYNALWNTNL